MENFIPAEEVERKVIERTEQKRVVDKKGNESFVDKVYKSVKLFAKGVDVSNYKKCGNCGGYTRPGKTKWLNHWDRHCRGCNARL